MEKGLPLSAYMIPFLENCQEHSAQNKSTSVSAYFSHIPVCTTILYILCNKVFYPMNLSILVYMESSCYSFHLQRLRLYIFLPSCKGCVISILQEMVTKQNEI